MEKTGRDKIADIRKNIGSGLLISHSPRPPIDFFSTPSPVLPITPLFFLPHSFAGHGNEDDRDDIRRFKFSGPFDNSL